MRARNGNVNEFSCWTLFLVRDEGRKIATFFALPSRSRARDVRFEHTKSMYCLQEEHKTQDYV